MMEKKNQWGGKMAKFYLYYNHNSDTQVVDILKVKIDNEATYEIKKLETLEVELPNGTHNVKMYAQGWGKDDLVGFIDTDIEVNSDVFYVYKAPMFINGKGTLTKTNYTSKEEFDKHNSNSSTIYKVLIALGIIVYFIIWLFK